MVYILELIPPVLAFEATTAGCLEQSLVLLYFRVKVTDNFNIFCWQGFLFTIELIFAEGVGVLFHEDDIRLFWGILALGMHLV